MDTVLIEEEQISLLGKMLYYSAKHLTTREREIYDGLVESLLRKVNQTRSMERSQSISSVTDAQNEAKRKELRQCRPDQLCKKFIDAWNKQDFETEFFCLAHSFPLRKRKTDNVHEYVLQRMKKYQDRREVGPISKRIEEITTSQTHGNKTSVYCIELHRMPDKTLTLHREYELIFEDGSWKIADYATIKSHESNLPGQA